MNAELFAEIDNAQRCLLETFNLALEFGDEESQNPETYLNHFIRLLTIKQNAKQTDVAMELAKNQNSTQDFEREFQKQIQVVLSKKYDAKKSTDYKNFKQELLQTKAMRGISVGASCSNTTRVENDDFVMESEINIFDPLTKQRMQNPVRNTICNHHYEKASILEAVKITRRLRCPVAGCGNKEFVTENCLIDDKMFQIRLQKFKDVEYE